MYARKKYNHVSSDTSSVCVRGRGGGRGRGIGDCQETKLFLPEHINGWPQHKVRVKARVHKSYVLYSYKLLADPASRLATACVARATPRPRRLKSSVTDRQTDRQLCFIDIDNPDVHIFLSEILDWENRKGKNKQINAKSTLINYNVVPFLADDLFLPEPLAGALAFSSAVSETGWTLLFGTGDPNTSCGSVISLSPSPGKLKRLTVRHEYSCSTGMIAHCLRLRRTILFFCSPSEHEPRFLKRSQNEAFSICQKRHSTIFSQIVLHSIGKPGIITRGPCS